MNTNQELTWVIGTNGAAAPDARGVCRLGTSRTAGGTAFPTNQNGGATLLKPPLSSRELMLRDCVSNTSTSAFMAWEGRCQPPDDSAQRHRTRRCDFEQRCDRRLSRTDQPLSQSIKRSRHFVLELGSRYRCPATQADPHWRRQPIVAAGTRARSPDGQESRKDASDRIQAPDRGAGRHGRRGQAGPKHWQPPRG
jgi:hypothetical protein